MRTRSSRVFLILTALVILFTTGAAPARVATDEVTFAGSSFIEGKGLVLYFNVDPGFDVDGAAKYVVIDGVRYDLACRLREDGLLACLVDQVGKSSFGETADIHFGPYEFETIIREPHERIPNYCYPVYDFSGTWVQVGTHCQDSAAYDGEGINFGGTPHTFDSSGQRGPGFYQLFT